MCSAHYPCPFPGDHDVVLCQVDDSWWPPHTDLTSTSSPASETRGEEQETRGEEQLGSQNVLYTGFLRARGLMQ